ncbi:MAG: hypothetical protein AB9842_07630 [Bacteroidales bacterium]
MKRFFLLLLLFLPGVLNAQQAVYEKSTQIEKKDNRDFLVHKVLKGQTLYAISKLYDTELDSVLYYNPLIRNGLKTGMDLYIPVPVSVPGKPSPQPAETIIADSKGKKDTIPAKKDNLDCQAVFHTGPFNVAIMLPLYLAEVDSIPSEISDDELNGADPKPLRFIQFYEGALLALDSLVNMGVSINLMVFDVDEDTNRLKKVLKNPDLKKLDLIIGLLYGASFQKLSAFAKENKIAIVNPLSNKSKHIEDNPYVFLANCTVKTMAEQIASYLSTEYQDNVIVLLNSGKENEKRSMMIIYDQLLNEFKKQGKPTQNIYIFSGEREIPKISALLNDTDQNAVIVLTNDELFVANAMRFLKEWASTRSVMVFGMPGWLDFKSIDSKLIVELNFHSFGTSFIDYSVESTKNFILNFRDEYKTEPLELAFQGFDVTYYFISSLMKYGKNFSSCTPFYQHTGMQTRFIFRQSDNHGFENNWLNIYKIQDYQVRNARD